jgi:hypothetical protein
VGDLDLNSRYSVLQHQTLMVEIFFVERTIVQLLGLRGARVVIDSAPGFKSICP